MSTVTIHVGSNLDVLPTLAENSIDAIVTDPPYELGFMGKAWDASGIAYNVELWRQCLRVLKPGGHLLAFSGSRTYHRMTCAIEDAGFEVRDQIMWVYGSGFPKSLNVGKALDKAAGVEREVVGYSNGFGKGSTFSSEYQTSQGYRPAYKEKAGEKVAITEPSTDAAKQWDGWGTALKPAHEPICVARKPLNGTVADNVMKWGTGAINVDGCRVGTEGGGQNGSNGCKTGDWGFNKINKSEVEIGRWPANLIHDGSEEVLELFPGDTESSAARFFYCPKASKKDRDDGCEGMEEKKADTRTETAAGHWKSPVRHNFHPTVKPTELMRYLCRLVTPPGGTVLDPFMGSGSTGRGAVLESFAFTGIELSDEYAVIARARIDAALKSRQTPS